MEAIFPLFSGTLTEALTIGAILGAIIGLVLRTASSAAEGIRRVLVGAIVGALAMGIYQGIRIGGAAGGSLSESFATFVNVDAPIVGSMALEGLIRVVQAAVAGAVFMVILIAPFKALIGSLMGMFVGIGAAIISWAALDLLEAGTTVPRALFGLLVVVIVLSVFEMIQGETGIGG